MKYEPLSPPPPPPPPSLKYLSGALGCIKHILENRVVQSSDFKPKFTRRSNLTLSVIIYRHLSVKLNAYNKSTIMNICVCGFFIENLTSVCRCSSHNSILVQHAYRVMVVDWSITLQQ